LIAGATMPGSYEAMNTEPIPQQLPIRRLACARCGTVFDCGAGGKDGGCWCMNEPVRAPLPVNAAGDCLCPACMRAAASTLR
jgi:uncharacterized protein